MRFLIDNNLSPKLADLLADAGHDASHVRDLGLGSANDEVVLDRARLENRVLISADTDFGTLLARTGAISPSFLLIRRAANRRVAEQAVLLVANLPVVEDDLEAGAIVVIGESSLRIRRLPIGSD
jgi:predicted nuclease of predicted toxin-antitoxin system